MENSKGILDSSLLEAMFQAAGEGLVVVDNTGVICMVNPRIQEMFGYSPEELVGEKIEILIPRERRDVHSSERKSYLKDPQKRTMGIGRDLAGERKDGSTFPIEVSLNNFTDHDNVYVMAMVTDISIRKQAEQELHELNEKLESLVESRTRELKQSQYLYREVARNFPKGTINVFDKDLKYVFVEGEDLYKAGITSSRLMGTSYMKHLPVEVRELINSELQEVFKGVKKSFEVSIPKGTYSLNCVPLRDTSGKVNQILVVEQNITQLKKAQEDMQYALSKEKELSEMKSRFVSMASHEFRTPLSTIMSSSNLIERYESEDKLEKRNKHIKRIQSNVKNLTSILNDFLSISKLEEGKVSVDASEFELREFIVELAEEMQEIAKAGQTIVLDCDFPECSISTDRAHLKNILINLVSNAIKYSAEGKTITLRCRDLVENFLIEVEDQGIGIPKSEQQAMFERFFRAKNAINIQGTGLGLYIVKRYTEQLGGSIEFESEYEKGSIFRLTLPKNHMNGSENIAD
jgi:PAS domain S-box-containing protein